MALGIRTGRARIVGIKGDQLGKAIAIKARSAGDMCEAEHDRLTPEHAELAFELADGTTFAVRPLAEIQVIPFRSAGSRLDPSDAVPLEALDDEGERKWRK
jgi:hypothetical protein